MVAKIIDGKKMAEDIRRDLKKKIFDEKLSLKMAVVLVGNNEASEIYVRNKVKAASEVGIECEVLRREEKVSEAEVLKLVEKLNDDDSVDGILVQLPLPRHIDALKVVSKVSFRKDIDGFSPYNAGLLQFRSEEGIVAATPKGVLAMIKSVCKNLKGKHAVVIGRSNIVGRPLSTLLLNNDCTVSIAHSKTKNLKDLTVEADIVVAACGRAKMIKKDWIKKGAIVVDVGINKFKGKICGDVDFDEVKEVASYISPVPCGVGPMTIAMLLDNVYLARKQAKRK